MAINSQEPASVSTIGANLSRLLNKARDVKQVTTVEPTLPAAPFIEGLHHFIDGSQLSGTEHQQHTAVEVASRNILYESLRSTSIHDASFVRVWDLLDLLMFCAEEGQCEPSLPFWLIEEIIESQTTDCCRVVFDYLESRGERLMRRRFHTTHLVVLRACNELLRRLSRAEDAVFCGRVFFFLFKSFPLGDKSSVNLRGEFHVDNVTSFEKDLEPLPSTKKSEETKSAIDGADKMETDPTPTTEDIPREGHSQLYPIFWRLQESFSVPTRLFEDANFTAFKDGLRLTMDTFANTPVVVQTKAASDEPRGTKRKLALISTAKFTDNYNPKYLTSRDLFELELTDLAFQRHILVQALILIDFLLAITEKAKKKLAEASISKMNQSLVYQYVLSDDDRDWAASTRRKIATYLQKGQDGNFYYRMVDTVLARDKNWVRWKMENCPSIIKDAEPAERHLEARANARQVTASRRMRAKPMGAVDLSFLANMDNVKGLGRLKDPARYTGPSIEALLKGIDNDELDLDMAMTDEEKQSLQAAKDSKEWRTLRTAAMTCLPKLDKVEPGKRLQDVFNKVENEPAPVLPEESAKPTDDQPAPALAEETARRVEDQPSPAPPEETTKPVEADSPTSQKPSIAIEPVAAESGTAPIADGAGASSTQ